MPVILEEAERWCQDSEPDVELQSPASQAPYYAMADPTGHLHHLLDGYFGASYFTSLSTGFLMHSMQVIILSR